MPCIDCREAAPNNAFTASHGEIHQSTRPQCRYNATDFGLNHSMIHTPLLFFFAVQNWPKFVLLLQGTVNPISSIANANAAESPYNADARPRNTTTLSVWSPRSSPPVPAGHITWAQRAINNCYEFMRMFIRIHVFECRIIQISSDFVVFVWNRNDNLQWLTWAFSHGVRV